MSISQYSIVNIRVIRRVKERFQQQYRPSNAINMIANGFFVVDKTVKVDVAAPSSIQGDDAGKYERMQNPPPIWYWRLYDGVMYLTLHIQWLPQREAVQYTVYSVHCALRTTTNNVRCCSTRCTVLSTVYYCHGTVQNTSKSKRGSVYSLIVLKQQQSLSDNDWQLVREAVGNYFFRNFSR